MDAYGGIDLGGTKIQAIVLDRRREVLASARAATPVKGGPAAVVGAMAQCMRAALDDAPAAAGALRGVGVGSPGEVQQANGVVARAGNLPGWEEPFALGPALSGLLDGVAVRIGNDVDRATWAEFELGAGRGASSLIGVFWGTGVGGGLVLAGELWQGLGGAGEIGHVVVQQNGARCSCGRRGCMEAYAGRASMEAQARRKVDKGRKTKLFEIMAAKGRDRLSSAVWEQALQHGDELAQELIERAVKALGSAVASVVNLLDVELVVLGGGLGTRLGEEMAGRISAAMLPHVFHDSRPPPVRLAELGDLGGAIGAALLCVPQDS